MTQIIPKFHLAFGGAGPFARLSEHAYPAGIVCGRLRRREVL